MRLQNWRSLFPRRRCLRSFRSSERWGGRWRPRWSVQFAWPSQERALLLAAPEVTSFAKGVLIRSKEVKESVLIENIRHQCDLEGCEEMVPFKNYKKHQMECKYRLVKCPGCNFGCSTLVPFCEVEDHAKRCSDIIAWSNPGNTRWPRHDKQQPCLNSVARFKQCSSLTKVPCLNMAPWLNSATLFKPCCCSK